MPNHLINEKSLYLHQHAENPVEWYPWGDQALERARREDKPLLVSIGYSACHWCHVMAHESFENEYIASLMNRHFVCIKVDREERPEIDRLYMDAVQMITSHGGWPLNVFCFPDGRPFFGGTYFPPNDRGQGIVPWPQLIMRVSEFFAGNRDQLEENADSILKNLAIANRAPPEAGSTLQHHHLVAAAEHFCNEHDDAWGGFGEAPKFPPSMALNFLLQMRNTAAVEVSRPQLAERIDKVVPKTLTSMAKGGIFDQIGGGFARYSVDQYWRIPHFEKMLYDNGLLLDIFTKGWLRYQDPLYACVVAETVEWLDREMSNAHGSFSAALDADSEGVEGRYYVWTPDQISEVLGEEEGKRFRTVYGITNSGNFEDGASNPWLTSDEPSDRESTGDHRSKLLQARQKRVAPGLDTKILLSWNSLLIRGLAEAGFYFGNRTWLRRARRAADWLWDTFCRDGNRLGSVYYDAAADGNGNLDDYAHFIEALLTLAGKVDWIDPASSQRYLGRAKKLADAVMKHFGSDSEAGFFFTSDDHEVLVSRQIIRFDNATPAGNSSLVHSFAMLASLFSNGEFAASLESLRKGYPGYAQRAPGAIPHALAGFAEEALGIAVIKVGGEEPIEPLRAALAMRPWRRTFLLSADDPALGQGFQLCIGNQCLEPSRDAEAVAQLVA